MVKIYKRMFIRKRQIKLKSGEVSTSYQAIVMVKKSDKKVRKAITLGDYANPIEALTWERKVLKVVKKNLDYPIDQYKEIRHSARYNRPIVVSVPVKTAKKKRIFWVKLYKKQKERVEVLERLVSHVYRENRYKTDTRVQE
jgi:hypothetical protein